MSKALVEATIAVANKYVAAKIRELKRNSGPEIDVWLGNVHLQPGDPYCVAGIWSWVDEAAKSIGEVNPLPRVGSVQKLARATVHGPLWTQTPKRGAVGMHLRPDGKGHLILVTWVHDGAPGYLATAEANTDGGGSREGDGVYAKTRPLDYCNMGYIDLERADPKVVVVRS